MLISPEAPSHPREVPAGALTSPILLSPNGRSLVYFDLESRQPVGWDVVNRRELFRLSGLPVPASPSSIAADNIHFALGFPNGAVAIIDLREGKIVSTFPAHGGFCYACDFSPDARFLATAGFDGLVKLWDLRTLKQLAEFHSSADAYWSVSLSLDGRRIAAGTGDSTVVLWDVVSRQEVGNFPIGETFGPAEGQLRFTPDGEALVFAGPSRWRVWQAPNARTEFNANSSP
jgi:WD40 repeat protein